MQSGFKKLQIRLACLFLTCLFIGGCLMIGGCDGTESREKVNDTVETVTEKKDLEHYQQMKEDLSDIQSKEAEQAERYRQLDPNPRQE